MNRSDKARRDKKRKGRKKRTASDKNDERYRDRNGTNKKPKRQRRQHHSYTLSRTTNNPFNLVTSSRSIVGSVPSTSTAPNLALIQTNSGNERVAIPSLMQANTTSDAFSPPIATISPRRNHRQNHFAPTTRNGAVSVDHTLPVKAPSGANRPIYGQNIASTQPSQWSQYPKYPPSTQPKMPPLHTRQRTVTPPHLKHKPLPSLPSKPQAQRPPNTRSKSVHSNVSTNYLDGSLSDTTNNNSNDNPFHSQRLPSSSALGGTGPCLKRKRSNSSPDVNGPNGLNVANDLRYPAPPPPSFGIHHQHSVPMQGMHYSEPFQMPFANGGYQSDPNMQKSNSNPFMSSNSNHHIHTFNHVAHGMNGANHRTMNGLNGMNPMNGVRFNGVAMNGVGMNGPNSMNGMNPLNGINGMNGMNHNGMNGVRFNGQNGSNQVNGDINIQSTIMNNSAPSSTHFVNYPTSPVDTDRGHDAEDEEDESEGTEQLLEEDEPDLSSPDISSFTDSSAFTTDLRSPPSRQSRGKSVGDALISASRPISPLIGHERGMSLNESNRNVSIASQCTKTTKITKSTKTTKSKKRNFRPRGRRLSDSEVVTPSVNSPYHPNNRQQPTFSQYKRRKEKIKSQGYEPGIERKRTHHLVLQSQQSGDSEDKEGSMPPPSPATSAVSSLRTPNPTTPNMAIPPPSVPNTLQVNPLRLLVSKSADLPSSVTPSPQPIPILLPGQDLGHSSGHLGGHFDDKRVSASFSNVMMVNALYGVSPDSDSSSGEALFHIEEEDENEVSPVEDAMPPRHMKQHSALPPDTPSALAQKRSSQVRVRRNSDSVVWTPTRVSVKEEAYFRDLSQSPKKRRKKKKKKKSLHKRFMQKYGRKRW